MDKRGPLIHEVAQPGVMVNMIAVVMAEVLNQVIHLLIQVMQLRVDRFQRRQDHFHGLPFSGFGFCH